MSFFKKLFGGGGGTAAAPKAVKSAEHKGFTIEVYHDLRGQWRFRLRKADGSSIRMPNDPVESSQVISRPYSRKVTVDSMATRRS